MFAHLYDLDNAKYVFAHLCDLDNAEYVFAQLYYLDNDEYVFSVVQMQTPQVGCSSIDFEGFGSLSCEGSRHSRM